MAQGEFIVAMVALAFAVFIIARGELPLYLELLI